MAGAVLQLALILSYPRSGTNPGHELKPFFFSKNRNSDFYDVHVDLGHQPLRKVICLSGSNDKNQVCLELDLLAPLATS